MRSFSVAETIIIDAGHGGRDPGAVYQGRKESDDVLRLALALGDRLKQAGYNVLYTRTTDVYNTPYEKAVIGNNSGADLFVSLHRNAVEQPNTSTGVETLVYKDTGLPGELARNINAQLSELGFADRGVIERPGLVVLRRTQMPAVLIEAGFINNEENNALFDEQLEEIARAFASRSNADRLRDRLINDGFPAFTILRDGMYKVQVGAYRNLENAIRMEQVLRGKGYSTFISNN